MISKTFFPMVAGVFALVPAVSAEQAGNGHYISGSDGVVPECSYIRSLGKKQLFRQATKLNL